jgi:hypothetical protein
MIRQGTFRNSEENPNSTIEQFQAVWCGGTVQFLSKLCPDAQLKPVRIPVRKGNVLAIPSFLPHSGPSVPAPQESADLFLQDQRFCIVVVMYDLLANSTHFMYAHCRTEILWQSIIRQ